MTVEAKKGLTEGPALALKRQSSAGAENKGSRVRQPGFRSQLCHCVAVSFPKLRVRHWYLLHRVIMGIKRIAT